MNACASTRPSHGETQFVNHLEQQRTYSISWERIFAVHRRVTVARRRLNLTPIRTNAGKGLTVIHDFWYFPLVEPKTKDLMSLK